MEERPSIDRRSYWRKQLKRIVILLVVWFVFGYVLSIFLIEPLNAIQIGGGMPLGFWFAQQGSIYVFVGLILIYAVSTGRLDRRAGVQEPEEAAPPDDGHGDPS